MDIYGKITHVLEERSGVSSRNGSTWRVATYVLETVDTQYPRKMCFEVFGEDRIKTMNIQVGELMTVRFDVDAHEYNGRWYNQIRAFAVDRSTPGQAAPAPQAAPAGMPPVIDNLPPIDAAPAGDASSDLPF